MRKSNEEKVEKTFDYIVDYTKRVGYPPSVRDVCKDLNIKSTATVYAQIIELQKQGKLKKGVGKNRAIEIVDRSRLVDSNLVSVPVVGAITAGIPITVEESISEVYNMPEGMFRGNNLFMLNVYGESMKGVGINDGDLIVANRQSVAQNGQIVCAIINGEATVKRLILNEKKPILHPENPEFDDIDASDAEIVGIVVGLIRRFK